MIFSNRHTRRLYPVPQLNGIPIEEVTHHKHLGLELSNDLSWDQHIEQIAKKTNKFIGQLWTLNRHLPRRALEDMYLTFMRPIIEYGCTIYDNCSVGQTNRLERIQRRAALACTRAYAHTSHNMLLRELGWNKLSERREYLKLCMFYRITTNHSPGYLYDLLPRQMDLQNRLRNQNNVRQIQTRLARFQGSYIPNCIHLWNELEISIRSQETFNLFKTRLRKHLLKNTRSYIRSYGHGAGQINHARFRMGLSALNFHRHRYNFIDHQSCDHCQQTEDVHHFLMDCPRYTHLRLQLMNELGQVPNLDITVMTTHVLMHGSDVRSIDNRLIFRAVQKFIMNSQRFN